MLWDECTERTFYKHICGNDNFIYLNSKSIWYSKTAQIVLDYLKKDPKNIVLLRRCLQNQIPGEGNSVCLFEVFSRDLLFNRQTRNKPQE